MIWLNEKPVRILKCKWQMEGEGMSGRSKGTDEGVGKGVGSGVKRDSKGRRALGKG